MGPDHADVLAHEAVIDRDAKERGICRPRSRKAEASVNVPQICLLRELVERLRPRDIVEVAADRQLFLQPLPPCCQGFELAIVNRACEGV